MYYVIQSTANNLDTRITTPLLLPNMTGLTFIIILKNEFAYYSLHLTHDTFNSADK